MRIAPGQPVEVAAQQAVLGLLPDGPGVVPDTDVAAAAVTVEPTASSAGGYAMNGRNDERPRGGLVDVFA